MTSLALVEKQQTPAFVRRVVFDEETIRCRVGQLAAEISRDYDGLELVVVGILNGAYIFASDLVRRLSIPVLLDFVGISRYKRAPGLKEVKITQDLGIGIQGRHLLFVEDIVDTGFTLNYLVKIFQARNAASIAVCSLLDRPALRLAHIPMRYVGFNIDQEFLIGYGLDYRDRYRELPYIAEMQV